jgi:predicted metal-dependent enzyme (double-stranded beta helix superfamily)
MGDIFADFIADCRGEIDRCAEAADRVVAIAPLMRRLVAEVGPHLTAEHRRGDTAHYARNALHIDPSGDLSLFALVWLPGQWTPVHDHGSWGVVGIVEGVLEERALMCAHGDIAADEGIVLRRGGIVLLPPGSVTSFVPNPDHIHVTGVPAEREACLSLHLYGRNMNSFHVYDVAAGTRRLIEVAHHQLRAATG